MNKKELYQRAIDQWGETAQISMAVEECSEFITMITKLYRKHNGSDVNDVMGEIADVEIMMEQMRLIFPSERIDEIKKLKLQRLEDLLDTIKGSVERR